MDLGQYVSDLQRQLVEAAENGAKDTRAVAERLAGGLDAATRLVLLDALSAAAGEITRDLAPGSVQLRLRAGSPGFVVTPPPAEQPGPDTAAPEPVEYADTADDGAVSRINFRLPDQLKGRIEEAAGRDGLSVNAWLVRAATAAVQIGDRPRTARAPLGGDRFTGWAR